MEDAAFFYLHELEDVIREWTALVYHRSKHDGLTLPEWPHLDLSPNDMYEIGLARAGMLRIPATPDLAYDLLDTAARTIQHYGVDVDGLRYNGSGLDGYRSARSPYGGALDGKWPIRVNLAHQGVFELGDGAEDLEEHPAHGGGRTLGLQKRQDRVV